MTPPVPAIPLVSIVTPAYRAGGWLQRCLDNVASQGYPNIEHIVVDAGSTDETLDILRGSAGVAWISEPDRGQSHAINKGFRLANGSLVGWLNADDLLHEGAVERAVRLFQQRPDLGWVYGAVRLTGGGTDVDVRPPRVLTRKHFFRGTPVPQPGSLFSRAALDQVGELDEGLHYAMDLDLWCRFYRGGIASARAPGVAATFEIHPASKSGGVPHVDFVLDQARALLQNEMREEAAACLGRAIALRAWDGRQLDDEVVARERQQVDAEFPRLRDHESWVLQGLRAEGAILALKAKPSGALASIVRDGVWRESPARQRALGASQMAAGRMRARWRPSIRVR